MESIIPIKGRVKFSITLDPGVWIFDDRRIDLDTFFTEKKEVVDELEEYKKNISKHWDREIMEAAVFPPTLKSEKKYEKEKILTGSFAIALKPFLQHAEIEEGASVLRVITTEDELTFPLSIASDFILAFSHQGKPLAADGPVHIYFQDGSNQHHPIKNIRAFVVE